MGKVTVIDNTRLYLTAFGKATTAAGEQVKAEVLESIEWQMMYGYSEPHGDDGHTEIYQTGALLGSVEADKTHFTGGFYGWQVKASANTYYASFVHNGTYKLNGRPFITDGVKRCMPKVQSIIKAAMK